MPRELSAYAVEHVSEVAGVPAGFLAAHLEAGLGPRGAHQVHGYRAEDGHVFRPVAGPQATLLHSREVLVAAISAINLLMTSSCGPQHNVATIWEESVAGGGQSPPFKILKLLDFCKLK